MSVFPEYNNFPSMAGFLHVSLFVEINTNLDQSLPYQIEYVFLFEYEQKIEFSKILD